MVDTKQLLFLIDTAYDKVSWHGPNLRALATGVAAHDLYHAGQIQLLKRLAGSPS